jgi:hypothetical protein
MSQLLSNPTESQTYFFTRRELERLTAYRAAVAASFYTDQCNEPSDFVADEPFRLEDLQLSSPYAA